MAFFDWNGNGKKDLQDDYLEYKIWNDDEDDIILLHTKKSMTATPITVLTKWK